MIYARINVNVDTGVYLFLHISCGTEYSQHSNALAHPNPSANSNKFKLLPYHCYAKALRLFNMKITHDFDAKNDETTLALTLPAVNYVGTYSPKRRIILDKTF